MKRRVGLILIVIVLSLGATFFSQHIARDYPLPQGIGLDAVGVERCHLWGGCIGVAFNLKFIQENPDRVTAAVCQDVVGLVAGVNTRATFFAMFEPTLEAARRGGMAAVVAAALENPTFMANNAAGPFAARIASDERFRDEVLALDPAEYERIIRAYDEQLWGAHGAYMSVEES